MLRAQETGAVERTKPINIHFNKAPWMWIEIRLVSNHCLQRHRVYVALHNEQSCNRLIRRIQRAWKAKEKRRGREGERVEEMEREKKRWKKYTRTLVSTIPSKF